MAKPRGKRGKQAMVRVAVYVPLAAIALKGEIQRRRQITCGYVQADREVLREALMTGLLRIHDTLPPDPDKNAILG